MLIIRTHQQTFTNIKEEHPEYLNTEADKDSTTEEDNSEVTENKFNSVLKNIESSQSSRESMKAGPSDANTNMLILQCQIENMQELQ